MVLLTWITDHFWWLALVLFFFGSFLLGGEDGLVRKIFDGRRRIARLRGELKGSQSVQKALSRENEKLHAMVERLLSGVPSEVRAQLTGPDPYLLFDLLRRVQATDITFPQLPQQLREDIDAVLGTTRGDG